MKEFIKNFIVDPYDGTLIIDNCTEKSFFKYLKTFSDEQIKSLSQFEVFVRYSGIFSYSVSVDLELKQELRKRKLLKIINKKY